MKQLWSTISIYSWIMICSIFCYAEDSIPATDLQEIVVKSERAWIEGGVYNFIPSKQEKKLSNSPGSLIDVMNLPFLKGDGENVITTTGEPVTIFINGQLASQTDLATFWPKLAKKVEYMVNPSGGAYAGYKNVVNFVISEYQVGGVTKANVLQSIPDNGKYRVGSKLVYKKMSYGALFEYDYNNDRPATSSVITSYRNIFYGGKEYDEITRTSEQEQTNRSRRCNLVLSALYQTQKFRALHTFGFVWRKNPGSYLHSTEEWSENIFGSDSFRSFSSLRSVSPQVSGLYNYFVLPDKFTMGGSWSYSFSHNSNDSWSRFGEIPTISNSVDEKVNVLTANIYFNYYFSNQFIMQLMGNGSFNWFTSIYDGTANDKSSQSRSEYSAQLSAFLYPSVYMNIVGMVGLMESAYRIGGTDMHYLNPTASLEASWNPNRKLGMRLGMRTLMLPAKSSSTNPVLIQSSDLLWVTGNPLLKPQITYMGDFSVNYLPMEWMSASGGVSYERQFHTPYSIYEAAPKEMGGIIRTEDNASPSDRIDAMVGLSFHLLDRNLSVGVSPKYSFFKARGNYRRTLDDFSFTANASYILKNFRFSAFYQGSDKKLSPAGNAVYRQKDQLSLGVSYSFNDVFIRCTVNNVFHRRFKTSEVADYNVYSVVSNEATTGRKLSLELTYTIGYGKKMNKSISFSNPSSVESSIMSD